MLLIFACLVAATIADKAEDLIKSLPGYDGPIPARFYSGHLNVSGTLSIHYIFCESLRDPLVDPVTVWQQGGPGGSSIAVGLFTEMGYWHLNNQSLNGIKPGDPPRPLVNPNAWNRYSNMLYLDHPAGVGFSYCIDPSTGRVNDTCTWDDQSQAVAMVETLKVFYSFWPTLKTNPLFLTGESYSGQYVPNIATAILNTPDFPATLTGFMIGNGCFGYNNPNDPVHNTDQACNGPNYTAHYVELMYGHGFINKELHERLVAAGPNPPQPLLDEMQRQTGSFDPYFIYDDCPESDHVRLDLGGDAPVRTGMRFHGAAVRPSPLSRGSIGGGYPYPCGGEAVTSAYLARKDVQEALHITGTYGLSQFNYNAFTSPARLLYPRLLKELKRVVIYNGDADTVCPYNVNYEWLTLHLPLLPYKSWVPWYDSASPSIVAGGVEVFAVDSRLARDHYLTFATVRLAGHMVPTYQPSRALDLFRRYIDDQWN